MQVTFEEGTSAAWLRTICSSLTLAKVVVCDPRKNALLKIAVATRTIGWMHETE